MKALVPIKAIAIALLVTACGQTPSTSQPLVTDVEHTAVKRQSIGNCWLYAHASWLESLIKSANEEDLNISESYWTWWHWYGQIVNRSTREIQTGGFWYTSSDIILDHGFVLEGEFIADEADDEMSRAQSRALSYMNTQLKEGGALANREDRTPENVRAQLDIAFETDMAAAEAIARDPSEVIVTKWTVEGQDGDDELTTTLEQALQGNRDHAWNVVSFPRVYGENAQPSEWQIERREAVMKRVLKAMNDRWPVVMTLMIDFNALDITDSTFKASTLRDAGSLGTQGGHMVVLEDYVVDNVPHYGYIGEGDYPDEVKEAALEGDVVLLKAKNSWGTNRPDRGLTDGYNRFDWEYLTGQLEWKNGGSSDNTSFYTTLSSFVLPPGY